MESYVGSYRFHGRQFALTVDVLPGSSVVNTLWVDANSDGKFEATERHAMVTQKVDRGRTLWHQVSQPVAFELPIEGRTVWQTLLTASASMASDRAC